MIPEPIARWQEIAKSRDVSDLDTLLADDVVFLSPVVHTPQRGKAITTKYLAAANMVLGGENFHYIGQWFAKDSAVLEFVAVIDGIEINGADFIAWNGADQIVSFKVMIRPLKAIELVRQRMATQLARA